jgi:hypothetical protein
LIDLLRLLWPGDAEELIVQYGAIQESLVDPARQCHDVPIIRANEDAAMGLALVGQADEMPTIER